MDDTEFKHQTATVDGLDWHWVEMGEGPALLLLHGISESWRCWRHQMPTLAKQFRVIALDMKGYGQSGKPDTTYAADVVAGETIALLDHLGIDEFHLAGHDWGVMIGGHICNQVHDRVQRYARCCLSLHTYDERNSLHHQWNGQNPEKASELMSNADAYVRVWFDSSCKPKTRPDEEEIEEVTNAMMWFYHSMLGSGSSLSARSRELGLPTKPHEAWGGGGNPGVLKSAAS